MFDASSLPSYVHPQSARMADAVFGALQRYHRHTVEHIEHIPSVGPALLVVHHSFATYDIGLLGYAVFKELGRVPRALADRLIFNLPPLAMAADHLGAVEGQPHTAQRLLHDGELVMVAPGGMREALRSSREKYQISWERRMGFAKLAMQTGVPVVCAACPAADDLFTLYPNPWTRFFLEKLHFPIPLLRGRGATLLPRPVTLVHYVSEPVSPPPWNPQGDNTKSVEDFQRRIGAVMEKLLSKHSRS